MIKVKSKKYEWIHIYNPTKEDIDKLHQKYHFHELILEDLEEFSYENNVDFYEDEKIISLSLNFPKYDQKEKKYIVNPFFFII
jgi:Mg2+ and Co2+ transporter CorA